MTYKINYDLIKKGMIELAKHNLNQEEEINNRLGDEIKNNPLKVACALIVYNRLQSNLAEFERQCSNSFNKYLIGKVI